MKPKDREDVVFAGIVLILLFASAIVINTVKAYEGPQPKGCVSNISRSECT